MTTEESSRQTPTAGWIIASCDATEGEGTVRASARRHRLLVRAPADQTALADEILGRLTLDDAAVGPLMGDGPATPGPDLVLELRPLDAHRVELRPEWAAPIECAPAEAASRALTTINRRVLDLDPGCARVHGGATILGRDATVVVLGRSGAGKSTLVSHLVAGGRGRLVCDEMVSLFPGEQLVGGYTRPVAIKRSGFAHAPAEAMDLVASISPEAEVALLTAADLETTHGLQGRPALVVLLDRSEDADRPTWTSLTAIGAVEELAANNLDLTSRPASALGAYAWLASSVPAVRIRYRHAHDAVRTIDALLTDLPPAPAVAWSVSSWPPDGGVGPPPDEGARRPDHGVVTLQVGDEALLLHPQNRGLARLNAAGAACWAALGDEGGPPDGDGATHAFLAELDRRGFLSA